MADTTDTTNVATAEPPVPTTEVIQEDDPRWDCATMGNGICGPTDDVDTPAEPALDISGPAEASEVGVRLPSEELAPAERGEAFQCTIPGQVTECGIHPSDEPCLNGTTLYSVLPCEVIETHATTEVPRTFTPAQQELPATGAGASLLVGLGLTLAALGSGAIRLSRRHA